jgi:hypothetical protein
MRTLLKGRKDENGQGTVCYNSSIVLIISLAIPITVYILKWKDPILFEQLHK